MDTEAQVGSSKDHYEAAFKMLCTRRRQSLVKMRDVIAGLTNLVGDGKGEEWWLEHCQEALNDARSSYDLLAEHANPDDILDELSHL